MLPTNTHIPFPGLTKTKYLHPLHISIELSDKTGEIVVLEIPRENKPGELLGVPHHETLPNGTPRNYWVQHPIIHQIICFR